MQSVYWEGNPAAASNYKCVCHEMTTTENLHRHNITNQMAVWLK